MPSQKQRTHSDISKTGFCTRYSIQFEILVHQRDDHLPGPLSTPEGVVRYVDVASSIEPGGYIGSGDCIAVAVAQATLVITREVDEMGVLITLRVNKEDMGKIIGKAGQTAKSLRVLLRVIGSKNNARVNLKFVEPDGSEVPTPQESFN